MLRKKIIRLAKLFNGKLSRYYQINGRSPEYQILANLLTDKQADVVLAAGLRKVRTVSALSRRSGYVTEDIVRISGELAQLGFFSSWVEDGVRKYYADAFVPATMMNVLTNEVTVANHPEVAELFDRYIARMDDMFPANRAVGTGMVRVIPAAASISDKNSSDSGEDGSNSEESVVSDYDKLSYYLDNASKLCVSSCACAVARRVECEGDGTIENGLCLHLDRQAEYYIETGRGREITRNEALRLLRRTDSIGLIHTLVNTYAKGKALTICTSSYSTCLGLRGAIDKGTFVSVASNFIAERKDGCVACGKCMSSCPTNAIRMSSRFSLIDVQSILSPMRKNERNDEGVDYRERFEECDRSGTAPCMAYCRLGMPVQAFLNLTEAGEYEKAYELMLENNPFPTITSLLCVCESESHCARGRIDEAVAIKDVERFLSAKCSADHPIPSTINSAGTVYDDKIAIVGSGAAGMSCAYFLAKMGYRPVIFEKDNIPGGALSKYVPIYRIDKSIVEQEFDKLEKMGVEIRCGINVGVDITAEELKKAGFGAFMLAIGMQDGKFADASGNDAEGIYSGMEYLRMLNRNEIEIHKGDVVVVGDGIVAFSLARSIARKGGNDVFLFTKCSRDEIDMELEELLNAETEGVEVNNEWVISEVLGTAGRVSAAVFKKVIRKKGYGNESLPEYDENDIRTVECSTLIYAVNQVIDWCGLDKQFGIEIDPKKNLPVIDFRTFETSVPGVFAGGDMAEGDFGVADSIKEGRICAESIHRYLRKGQNLKIARRKGKYVPINRDSINYQSVDYSPVQRVHAEYDKRYVNRRSFFFGKVVYSDDQAKAEASRCLDCSKISYDADRCIGCGQCSAKCPTSSFGMAKRSRKDVFSDGYESNMSSLIVSRVVSSKGKGRK